MYADIINTESSKGLSFRVCVTGNYQLLLTAKEGTNLIVLSICFLISRVTVVSERPSMVGAGGSEGSSIEQYAYKDCYNNKT